MNVIEQLLSAKVYDLAQPYFVGMPHFPTHPPFLFSLTREHGDQVGPNRMSSAADAMALSAHTGTHIDALCHFSCGGRFHGGVECAGAQSYAGVRAHAAETIAPILRRGVLLDIAAGLGVQELDPAFTVTPEHLEAASARSRVEIRRGDVVLLRTGWGRNFESPRKYLPDATSPGPGLEGGRWLSSRGIFAAGSDTMTFEQAPNPAMPVHVHLLVECGIHIIENLDLEELARDRVREFFFVAAPLKIRGGTGAPMRPVALRF